MAANVPPLNPLAPIFALTPAALHTAAFVDLGSTEGRKMFTLATKPLDKPYDGAKTGLHMFIHQVTTRATICGWMTTILTMPTIADPDVNLSLLTQHGQIALIDIQAHANTYTNAFNKARQDALHMKLFLDGSLDDTLMMRVLAQKDKYTFAGTQNGPAMFRVILQIVGIETSASIAVIQAVLRTLPAKLLELNSNIVVFNEFVTEQINDLIVRGAEPNDALHLLFEAYGVANNPNFKEYIRSKENAVYDGTLVMDYQALMNTAEEKYKIMCIKGEWKTSKGAASVTANDQHIVALQALQAQVAALQANQFPKAPPGPSSATSNNDRKNNTGKWAWKDHAPKPNEPKIKTFEGRAYCHCPNHKSTKWVLADKHKDGCTLDPKWKYPSDETKSDPENKLNYAQALMHVIDEYTENGTYEIIENI
jgi:hypothetical protein